MTSEHPRPPGYRRLGASYVDDDGRAVTDGEVMARLQALAVPPAWRDVWVAADPEAKVQAVGVDSAARMSLEDGRTITGAVEEAAERTGDDRLAVLWRDPTVQEATLGLLKK